ncbi:MAG: AbrB/MazE/SpoVT family DNA-binding domain-containing protein [Thermoplasmata archaeon]|nr:AbrB/MazE/SpoVT family DNA-binding domain-containing protein [Thermoplasmata archaeon]
MTKKKLEEKPLVCPECDGDAEPMMINVSGLGVTGWRCKCGYEMLSPGELEKAYLFLQAQKHEKVKISKRGNSYMITIPKAIADAIGIENLDMAEVYLKDRKTIIVGI